MATLNTSFGTFKGKASDGVVQYLGIKYASLKDQLSVPEMIVSYGAAVVDATEFGPRAPAMDGCEYEQKVVIQQNIGVPKTPPMSGTECLNLNITMPAMKIDETLPVMVFIHGGGFIMGGNHWPQYDPSRLVRLSVEAGLSVIVVNINYRLGALGNLTSDELRAAGYPGNNSLRDQKCALLWIKTNINGFGGDPNNVTAIGESAGGVSVLNQLFSRKSLFKRAISMSGTPLMLKPLSPMVTEVTYDAIIKALDVETASSNECLQRLLTITPEELVAKTPLTAPLVPFLDGDIVSASTTFESLLSGREELEMETPGRQWCEELMIGNCQHDGNVFFFMGLAERKAGIASTLRTSLLNNLGAASSTAVLEAYSIEPTTDDDVAMQSIIDIATDIAYYAPSLAFARSWPGRTYYYHFDEPNPWDGTFKGYSTHMLDAAFLFQNFDEEMGENVRMVSIALAMDFLKFVNGIRPWDEFSRINGAVKGFGPSDVQTTKVLEGNGWADGRRDTLFKLEAEGKVNLDALSMAWDLFIAGK